MEGLYDAQTDFSSVSVKMHFLPILQKNQEPFIRQPFAIPSIMALEPLWSLTFAAVAGQLNWQSRRLRLKA